MSFDPPIFINVRDRLAPLVQLVTWLEKAGHQRIVLIDNDSTYEPLREYLNNSPHRVAHLYANGGTRAVWDAALAPSNDWYVYTDPDIVPIEECPLDLVEHLKVWLDKRPDFPKAGPGLYLDDLPESFPHRRVGDGPADPGHNPRPGRVRLADRHDVRAVSPGHAVQVRGDSDGLPVRGAAHLAFLVLR